MTWAPLPGYSSKLLIRVPTGRAPRGWASPSLAATETIRGISDAHLITTCAHQCQIHLLTCWKHSIGYWNLNVLFAKKDISKQKFLSYGVNSRFSFKNYRKTWRQRLTCHSTYDPRGLDEVTGLHVLCGDNPTLPVTASHQGYISRPGGRMKSTQYAVAFYCFIWTKIKATKIHTCGVWYTPTGHFIRHTAQLLIDVNQPIKYRPLNAFWHADIINTICCSSNETSAWGRKVI